MTNPVLIAPRHPTFAVREWQSAGDPQFDVCARDLQLLLAHVPDCVLHRQVKEQLRDRLSIYTVLDDRVHASRKPGKTDNIHDEDSVNAVSGQFNGLGTGNRFLSRPDPQRQCVRIGQDRQLEFGHHPALPGDSSQFVTFNGIRNEKGVLLETELGRVRSSANLG